MGRSVLERYARQIIIPEIGEEGQRRLMSSHVLLAGMGGLGSFSSLYLCCIGVGRLTFMDYDVVSISDLNRQPLCTKETVGRRKVDIAEIRLREFNPDIALQPVFEEITEESLSRYIDGVDVVVDATDNFKTRRILNTVCFRERVPLVYGGVQGLKGSVASMIPGHTPCLECFLPGDGPVKPVPVLAPAVGLVASIQVMETVNLLLGNGGILRGDLLKFDAGRLTFKRVRLKGRGGCPVCQGGNGT